MRIEIKDDLYDIAKRVREIHKEYAVFFETDLQKFVVTTGGDSFIVLPYDELDERTIRYLYFTRSDNLDEVERMVDQSNERLGEETLKRAQNDFEDKFSHEMRKKREDFVSGSFSSSSIKKGDI